MKDRHSQQHSPNWQNKLRPPQPPFLCLQMCRPQGKIFLGYCQSRFNRRDKIKYNPLKCWKKDQKEASMRFTDKLIQDLWSGLLRLLLPYPENDQVNDQVGTNSQDRGSSQGLLSSNPGKYSDFNCFKGTENSTDGRILGWCIPSEELSPNSVPTILTY